MPMMILALFDGVNCETRKKTKLLKEYLTIWKMGLLHFNVFFFHLIKMSEATQTSQKHFINT